MNYWKVRGSASTFPLCSLLCVWRPRYPSFYWTCSYCSGRQSEQTVSLWTYSNNTELNYIAIKLNKSSVVRCVVGYSHSVLFCIAFLGGISKAKIWCHMKKKMFYEEKNKWDPGWKWNDRNSFSTLWQYLPRSSVFWKPNTIARGAMKHFWTMD